MALPVKPAIQDTDYLLMHVQPVPWDPSQMGRLHAVSAQLAAQFVKVSPSVPSALTFTTFPAVAA
jgi:hypothetical protein